MLAFHVLLAVALSVQRVAVGLVVEAALAAAAAVPAAELAEVPVRGLAHVALGPGDAGLAVALAVGRALKQLGSDRVAVAGLAGRPPEFVLDGIQCSRQSLNLRHTSLSLAQALPRDHVG